MNYLLLALLWLFTLPALAQLQGSVSYSSVKGMIGARINTKGVVSEVRYRSPAQLSGLRKGDVINSVNFFPFSLGKIHGHPGDDLFLEVKRGDERLFFEMVYIDGRSIDYSTAPEEYYEERKIEWILRDPV